MHIPHGTLILIADGRKSLLFRNAGDADFPNFVEAEKLEDDNPADRQQKSDSAGHMRSSVASGGSACRETDLHEQAEARFARQAAERLNHRAAAAPRAGIVVAADPHTLGALRRHYSPEVQHALIAEFDKDLVKHPVSEIEKILSSCQ